MTSEYDGLISYAANCILLGFQHYHDPNSSQYLTLHEEAAASIISGAKLSGGDIQAARKAAFARVETLLQESISKVAPAIAASTDQEEIKNLIDSAFQNAAVVS
jgi:hypothetical protein